jgi:hypothetical protein
MPKREGRIIDNRSLGFGVHWLKLSREIPDGAFIGEVQ